MLSSRSLFFFFFLLFRFFLRLLRLEREGQGGTEDELDLKEDLDQVVLLPLTVFEGDEDLEHGDQGEAALGAHSLDQGRKDLGDNTGHPRLAAVLHDLKDQEEHVHARAPETLERIGTVEVAVGDEELLDIDLVFINFVHQLSGNIFRVFQERIFNFS